MEGFISDLLGVKGFNPLVIGELGGTRLAEPEEPQRDHVVSIPSSSGSWVERWVQAALWAYLRSFNPLVIGELGGAEIIGDQAYLYSYVSIPSSSGSWVELTVPVPPAALVPVF